VLARGIGHAEVESECERILGELALDEGDSASARSRFLRALAVSRDAADKRSEALALSWLGRVELAAGLGDHAEAHLRAALGAFQAFRMHGEALAALEDYAALLERRGEAAEAARLCGTIEASRTSMTLPRPPRAVMRWSALLDALTAALGDGHEAALAAGADVLLDDVLDRVLAAEAETDAVEEAA